jgi:hypothetical protein
MRTLTRSHQRAKGAHRPFPALLLLIQSIRERKMDGNQSAYEHDVANHQGTTTPKPLECLDVRQHSPNVLEVHT